MALELRSLQLAYASAVDRCDAKALRAVFCDDAVLRVFAPDSERPLVEARGHDQLVLMIDVMSERYAKTMHVMTNSASSGEGRQTVGSVYGVAHHLILDEGGPRTFVAYLRYEDLFGQTPEGDWRIARRDVHFLWTEERPALSWESALGRGLLA